MTRNFLLVLATLTMGTFTTVSPAFAGGATSERSTADRGSADERTAPTKPGGDRADAPDWFRDAAMTTEFDAYHAIISSMGDFIRGHDRDVPARALKAHRAGKRMYDSAVSLKKAGRDAEAYRTLRRAWSTHRPATDAFLKGATPGMLDKALPEIFGALDSRISAIDARIHDAPATARTEAAQAKALYRNAQSLRDAGDNRAAVAKAFQALRTYDRAVQIAWEHHRR